MDNGLLQLQNLPPQEQNLMVSSGFFHGDGGHVHFPSTEGRFISAPVSLVDCAWMEDLMQLGDELFRDYGGGDNDTNPGDHQPRQCDGNSLFGVPPPSWSFDDNGSIPSVGQGTGKLAPEPGRNNGDVSAPTQKRRDRSKTIVSERKRRVGMKEKLYELRSLVPNITKMDKASIIADAVVYVKNLQSHARKLKEEVATLQARPIPPRKEQQQDVAPIEGLHLGSTFTGARVTHVGAKQVGQGRFHVMVECERLGGVAAPLFAAVESLACFRVESSSLGRSGTDRVLSTLTLKATDQSAGDATMIGEGTVKLWVMSALLKEGFRLESSWVEIS